MPLDPQTPTSDSVESLLEFDDARPAMSILAIAAAVIGLIYVVPWPPFVAFAKWGTDSIGTGSAVGITGAIGTIILGILAIFKTRQNRKRGRWLGIIACMLGLLGIGTQYLVGWFLFNYVTCMHQGQAAAAILKVSASERPAAAAKWYEEMASERFKVTASAEYFEAWLESVATIHGQLQQGKRDPKKPVDYVNGIAVVRMKGQFVNGMSSIEVEIGFDGDEAKVDDIRVGDSSPLK